MQNKTGAILKEDERELSFMLGVGTSSEIKFIISIRVKI
jgi:hypothetical protein